MFRFHAEVAPLTHSEMKCSLASQISVEAIPFVSPIDIANNIWIGEDPKGPFSVSLEKAKKNLTAGDLTLRQIVR